MEIIHASNENFNELINDEYVLVDFFANWCGPCKMLSPILETLTDRIKIVKVDVDQCPELAQKYGVMSIPTLILIKKGETIIQNIGFMQEEELINWIEENR